MRLRTAIKVWTAAQRAFKATYGSVPDDIPDDMMRWILAGAGIRRQSFQRACDRLFSKRIANPGRFRRMFVAGRVEVPGPEYWAAVSRVAS